MRRFCLLCAVAAVLFVAARSATAAPVVIPDGFVGATADNAGYVGLDIIGDTDKFDVEKLVVDFTGGNLVVDIYSSFFDNVGAYGVELGDLFISTNGWSPFGVAPYVNDTAANGEVWEYALVIDNHGESYAATETPTSMVGASGLAHLYAIGAPGQIELSVSRPGYISRVDQEIQYNPNGSNPVATGSWGIVEAGFYDRLSLSISLASFLGGSDFGFHWTMSCGNDVIEGGSPIPEPASAALFGLGMLAAFSFRRRRV